MGALVRQPATAGKPHAAVAIATVLDEVRNVSANAAVEEHGILSRGGRCDVLSVDLGKTEYQPVDVLPDSGIRIQWSPITSEHLARQHVDAGFGQTRPVSSADG
jgi:hypothetical protein